jgi:leucyl-tRNA synthetase
VVTTPEPFQRLVSQGMILGEVEYTAYKSPQDEWVSADAPGVEDGSAAAAALEAVRLAPSDVEKQGEGYVLKEDKGIKVAARAHKMSKSRGNVINPDDIVAQVREGRMK